MKISKYIWILGIAVTAAVIIVPIVLFVPDQTPPPDLTADDFLRLMAVDKKVQDGRLRLILLRELGQGVIADGVDPVRLRETLEARR